MPKILIIGGTGMLQGATEHFIQCNYSVSVLARDTKKLNYFKNAYPDQDIELISLDYSNPNDFIAAVEQLGDLDSVICWMHGHAKESLFKLITLLSQTDTIFYHIKGSASYNPTAQATLQNTDGLDYREIILGFKRENGRSRWLSNTEIADGVITAVDHDMKYHVIGVTEPWDKRPS